MIDARFLVILCGYLLGSIPFGFLLTKLVGLGDIRDIGSGNIGATNVLRTGNKKLAALTLLLDGLKGSAAVVLAHFIAPDYAALAGLAALLGHLFPAWLKFKGGKGVATAIGVITALIWPLGLMIIGIWIAVAYATRFSSLAALVAFGFAPVGINILGQVHFLWLIVIITLLIFWKHSANIERLYLGTETKIGGTSRRAESTSPH